MSGWKVPTSLLIAFSWALPPPLYQAVICWETLGVVGVAVAEVVGVAVAEVVGEAVGVTVDVLLPLVATMMTTMSAMRAANALPTISSALRTRRRLGGAGRGGG